MSTELQAPNKVDRSIACELAITSNGNLDYGDITKVMELAKIMAVADIAIPKHLRSNPGACLSVALQAAAWEMNPFAVANKTYVVNDRIAFEAQLINAVILRRAPITGRMEVSYSGEGATRACTVSAELKSGGTVTYTSPTVGSIKTKNSPLWNSDPDQQLFYFASRSMCRRHFPDVLLGVYAPDEIEAVKEIAPMPNYGGAE